MKILDFFADSRLRAGESVDLIPKVVHGVMRSIIEEFLFFIP